VSETLFFCCFFSPTISASYLGLFGREQMEEGMEEGSGWRKVWRKVWRKGVDGGRYGGKYGGREWMEGERGCMSPNDQAIAAFSP